MKVKILIIACGVLMGICIVQQWLIRTHTDPTPSPLSEPIPEASWNVKLLANAIKAPPGATAIGASGVSINNLGFEAYVRLDISKVAFTGRAITYRGERIAVIAAYYAHQIADAIRGASVVVGVEQVSSAEAGALHSVYLVKYPRGHVAISAGYYTTRDGKVSDCAKIIMLSDNWGANGDRLMILSERMFSS